jgi:hypothetical protein
LAIPALRRDIRTIRPYERADGGSNGFATSDLGLGLQQSGAAASLYRDPAVEVLGLAPDAGFDLETGGRLRKFSRASLAIAASDRLRISIAAPRSRQLMMTFRNYNCMTSMRWLPTTDQQPTRKAARRPLPCHLSQLRARL